MPTMQTLSPGPHLTMRDDQAQSTTSLAELAVQALRDEALLTPKPGLVDRRGSGCHHDMTLGLMLASADALGPLFESMAAAAGGRPASLTLREELGVLGRDAETRMLCITGGVNTHRGAIWALGLLIAGCAATGTEGSIEEIVSFVADLAAMPDRFAGAAESHGGEVQRRFHAGGAKQEACEGFPHVLHYGLPALWHARSAGATEDEARILSLLAVMATLDDTCLLYRAGPDLLRATKEIAARAYRLQGTRTSNGFACVDELDRLLRTAWASPGGSADLLAATLFLDHFSSAISSEDRTLPCRN